jgi:UDP-N-acetyl-D-glucosamine dehydrogenase
LPKAHQKFLVKLDNSIVVVGLGYVGLPIAVSAAKSGFKVRGIELNQDKVFNINNGKSPIEDIKDDEILDLLERDKLYANSDFSEIRSADVVLICVPTPLTRVNMPDLSYLKSAIESISANLSKGTLIILESTVAPGTTREFLVPLIQKNSRIDISELDIAFSPERIDPLNPTWKLKNTPKVVAGLNLKSRKRAIDFYSKFVDNLIECENLEVAETAKLLENSFRLINISFINELSIFCQNLGIEINDVINAASTKPYGFMPFYPSIGIGGHCIPVDPLYLANKAQEIGAPAKMINLADQINKEMPGYFVGRAEEKLGGLKNKKVLVVGVSYKPNVSDVRESPVEALVNGLKQKGAQVSWHDDLVKDWNGEKSVALGNYFDLAIIATPHTYLDLTKLGDVPILNTRGSI